MEEEAPSRRSVAELAGRFKSSAPPNNAAGNEAEKPVRRRPPRTLQLPKTQGDDQEPPGVTSPLPTKAKRNSALIEKLQANLTLSPAALMPSPKSPGFRLLPQTFPAPSPGSTPVTTVTPTSPVATSPLTEVEGPASFEAPPVAEEGSILSNINKGRVRHSIRRRPPSRRHRKSSSGDEVVVANEGGDVSQSSPNEPEDKTGGGEKEEGGEVFKEEGKTDEVKDNTDAPTCPEEDHNHEEDQSKASVEPREGDEKEREEDNGSMRGQEGDGRKEDEEEKNSEKQEEDSTEGTTNTDSKEEEKSKETTSSDR